MAENSHTYFCIDMKSFYASVECAERCLNPFETNLVVADTTRGKNALCLAITPKMKAQGIRNRCRLSEIPRNIQYEIAMPRMQLYIEYAADIYGLYLNYFDPQDIHVYSIDESFIDVTGYLHALHTDPVSLAKRLMNEIWYSIPCDQNPVVNCVRCSTSRAECRILLSAARNWIGMCGCSTVRTVPSTSKRASCRHITRRTILQSYVGQIWIQPVQPLSGCSCWTRLPEAIRICSAIFKRRLATR